MDTKEEEDQDKPRLLYKARLAPETSLHALPILQLLLTIAQVALLLLGSGVFDSEEWTSFYSNSGLV